MVSKFKYVMLHNISICLRHIGVLLYILQHKPDNNQFNMSVLYDFYVV